jgi:O-succinylbenzoic acid--CoA ligase
MVLVRSRVAAVPVTALPGGPFTAEAFARATELLPRGLPRYTSLVPTQLERLLDSPAGRDALTAYDAVLVGGAALHTEDVPPVVVRTYGATETCGGCVYDGVPIGDTRVAVRAGVVHVTGASLAEGYADGDDSRFVTEGATRWFVTSDLGELDVQGRLRILGRADDVIITGGAKVAPAPVEAALAALPWVAEAVVIPVPHPEWGQAVVALATARPGHAAPAWESDRAHLAQELSREQLPRAMHVVASLPRLSSGKIDRAAAALIAAGRTQDQGATWPS